MQGMRIHAYFVVLATWLSALMLGACQHGGQQQTTSTIEWGNIIQLNNIQYQPSMLDIGVGRSLTPADLGPQYATIKFRLAGNINDPLYQMKHGDATVLDVGTPVYQINGYTPSFWLAVRRDEQIIRYDAILAATVTQGRDVLDLAGKIDKISLHRENDFSEMSTISEPADVQRLGALLLEASPTQPQASTSPPYSIYIVALQLRDGLAATYVYNYDTNRIALGDGLFPAIEFQQIIGRYIP